LDGKGHNCCLVSCVVYSRSFRDDSCQLIRIFPPAFCDLFIVLQGMNEQLCGKYIIDKGSGFGLGFVQDARGLNERLLHVLGLLHHVLSLGRRLLPPEEAVDASYGEQEHCYNRYLF
jgi:hypothetical protein